MNKLQITLDNFALFAQNNWPPELEKCVNVCCDLESFDPTEKLVENDKIYAAYGLHPHNAKDYTDQIEERIIKNMSHPKTVAWGEIGLDYHYNMSPPEVQREVFARQLKKAVELKKPIVIHTREAEDDTFRILKENVPAEWRLHIHCFTSSVKLAKDILEYFPNSFIGFTGVVTFKSARDIREVVTAVPVNRILLETDGPFMAPEPFRGKTAHSGHIPYIAKKIAEVKGIPVEEMLTAARDNTLRMYGI